MQPLMIRTAQVSDLFFNYDHGHHRELFAGQIECTRQGNVVQLHPEPDVRAAIVQDAEEFFQMYGEMLQLYVPEIEISADWFTDNFMKRL